MCDLGLLMKAVAGRSRRYRGGLRRSRRRGGPTGPSPGRAGRSQPAAGAASGRR